jgi:tripartite-type tricarboxylate transporter receptor subunit TctC
MPRSHTGGQACWAIFALLLVWSSSAAAQPGQSPFPSRSMQLVVPYPPGGVVDPVARILAPRLSADLGQPVVIENRSGAGGSIGASHVARARPDGYTILLHTGSGMVIQQLANTNAGYDARVDFTPVSLIAAAPYVVSASVNSSISSLATLVEMAKARPGALFYGSAGIGSSPHLITEMFNRSAGIEMRHVPYRGNGPMVNALVAGQEIQVGLDTIPGSRALADGGRLRMLAQTGPSRNAALPHLPTVSELGFPGFEATLWLGVFLPRGAPDPVVARWHAALLAALRDDATRARLQELGFDLETSSPEALGRKVAIELSQWDAVIRGANIRFE